MSEGGGGGVAVVLLAAAGCALIATVLADLLWAVLLAVRAHLFSRLHFFAVDLKTRYGSWAVVTGSTDGVGRAYAEELAKRGLNLVLVSRTREKLAKVAAQFESMYGVKTKIIAIDFSKGQAIFEEIRKELSDIPVGILVNNVGKQYTYPMYLGEVPEQDLWDIINVNVGAATAMTRLLLPHMRRRGRGAVVNVSSGSELQPLPLMTVYAATKVYLKSFSEALRTEYCGTGVTIQHLSLVFINTKMNSFNIGVYLKSFSEALRAEYRGAGITIQHLSPLFINTKMNAFSHRLQTSSLLVPDAETYARNAINTLGVVDHTTGYWAHGLQYFFTSIPPKWVRTYIGSQMNKLFRRDYTSAASVNSKIPVIKSF